MDTFLIKVSKSKKNTNAEKNVNLPEENHLSPEKRSKMDILPNTKDINQIQNAISSHVGTSKSDQTTNTLLISDNLNRDPGHKNTNALILFSSGFGPYQPNNIIFPQHLGRKFRTEWYTSFPWIEYSPSSNSAYCFYCRVFPSKTSDPTFVSVGFKQWSKASFKSFPQHEKSFGHKEASAKLAGYKNSKKSGSIISKVNTHHQQIVADNRAYLKCILDSLLFCARQGIAIRGHRVDEDSSNKGNFLELLTLRAKDNDIIQRYFIEKEKTFRYVSGDYTNTFLEYLANIVIENIIDNVIAAGIFSIIVDETQDLSRHEQVAIIIRYATKDLSPAEVFLGFYKTENTDGETLSMLIKSTLVSHGLKIENLRGQCYDGAASMRGSYKGVQARIKEENHLAMYIHCNAHILNLCLIDLAKQVSYVRNVFGTLNTLHNFIGASSKRHAIFEKMYSVLNISTCEGPKTLKSLSDTRWSCRLDALKAVLFNFQTVVSTLEDISENDAVYGSDANALLKSINTFEFLFCIYFLKKILLLTNILSKYLQSSSIIYSNVQSMAKETIQELCNMRCEESFNNTWNEVDILRKQYNVSSPILPRKQKIPAKLGGGLKEVENTTINKHYKINIYFAVLDNIINDMSERFEENNLYILNCMQDILLNDTPNNNSFKEINKMYGFDEDNLKAETKILNRMYKAVHNQSNVQSKINFIASENYKAGFPTLTSLIQLFITIPTNSASCERSFSCLRRLKTYLRTTMGQSRLNSLGILQIERERSSLIDKDLVIEKFSAAAECRGRRLLLQ
ncbi:zinc finger MYM-type protein 1-like [Rhopalosiphum maidis]|uniref:zinc finger MYM-type protein 1-like n=3 Tax=Rhopalosiphum maidis TaxID=43146 RepID=UPI000EFFCBF2|nr:zinc finger MYM-type protein 1-like [Rhopalosiphum maidis]